ncbi:unnamed protein product [Amoebophrya sp. A25]|nr:unnamed protein product [Amoebophrya sp. A25]|eukprot:GSA25T00008648001.1
MFVSLKSVLVPRLNTSRWVQWQDDEHYFCCCDHLILVVSPWYVCCCVLFRTYYLILRHPYDQHQKSSIRSATKKHRRTKQVRHNDFLNSGGIMIVNRT